MVAARFVVAGACIAFAVAAGQDGGARSAKKARPVGEAIAGVWVQYCGPEDEHVWNNGGMYRVAVRDGKLEMTVESLRDESPGIGESAGLSDVKFDGTTWRFHSAWPEHRTGVFELHRVGDDLFEGSAYATDGLTPPQRELWKRVTTSDANGETRTDAFAEIENETRKEFVTDGALTMVWWIPSEYFELVFDTAGSAIPAKLRDTQLREARAFSIVAVVDGRPPSGAGAGSKSDAPRFRTADEIRKSLKLVAPDGSEALPLTDAIAKQSAYPMNEQLARILLHVPAAAREEVRFFYFPTADASGAPKFTARSGGDLTLRYDGAPLQWHLLARGRATTPQIGRRFRLTRQALNRHVALLERAGLVARTLRGRAHEVELVPGRLDGVVDFVAELRRGWSASLDRLGEVLRESRT
jgi:hypothetical protein